MPRFGIAVGVVIVAIAVTTSAVVNSQEAGSRTTTARAATSKAQRFPARWIARFVSMGCRMRSLWTMEGHGAIRRGSALPG